MALQLSPASVEKEAQNWGSSELLVLMVKVANMRMEMMTIVIVNMILAALLQRLISRVNGSRYRKAFEDTFWR